MAREYNAGLCRAFGYGNVLAAIRFVPHATTPVINEQWGVKTLTRNGDGDYTITLDDKYPGFVVMAQGADNGTTLYNFVRVKTFSVANSTIQIEHKSCAFADVATGPALSDTVDYITVLVLARGQ